MRGGVILQKVTQLIAEVMAQSDSTYSYKFILLGDLDVGKTSFFLRLKNGTHDGRNTAAYRCAESDHLERTQVVDGATVKVSRTCAPAEVWIWCCELSAF